MENPETIDAIGIEPASGLVVLTIADDWDWGNQGQHLLALQAKLNAYFRFIESGQIRSKYPDSVGRSVIIDVVARYSTPEVGYELLNRAADVAKKLNVQIRSRHFPGSAT